MSDGDRVLQDLGTPPEKFDPEWARTVLAYRESLRPKPWFDRAGVVVALLASLAGAATSAVNLSMLRSDREERRSQQDVDDQGSWARMYFENVNHDVDFCRIRDNANAFALMVNNAAQRGQRPGMLALAGIIVDDAGRRSRACGGADVNIAPRPGQVVDAGASPAGVVSTYQLQQAIGSSTNAAGTNGFAIYVQYPRESGSQRAQQITAAVGASDTAHQFHFPRSEAVDVHPSSDQIRIYHREDTPIARQIAAAAGLEAATIVNLESAYRDLPHGTVEIWLGH